MHKVLSFALFLHTADKCFISLSYVIYCFEKLIIEILNLQISNKKNSS